ncbi:MAG: hypothetical protein KDB53_02230 [Planctomycetes bacterium]|nr:hypothetical protein [Planctomycetota bacterium]
MLKRRLLFALLYFSEGAPMGYLWFALPYQMKSAGISTLEVTAFTALIGIPWILKLVWALAIDALRSRRRGYRTWLLAAQAGMVVTLLPLFGLEPGHHLGLIRVFALCHAVCAATQDVSIDALVIASVEPRERGSVNGWMLAGRYTGGALFAGAGIAFGVRHPTALLSILFGVIVIAALAALGLDRGVTESPADPGRAIAAVGRKLRQALLTRRMAVAGAFALVSGAGFESLGGLMVSLLTDLQLEARQISTMTGLVRPLGLVAGALIGGVVADRLGPPRATGLFLMTSVLSIWILAASIDVRSAPLTAFFGMAFFAAGLFLASSYTLFMRLSDPSIAATQFTAFMALTNACEAWSHWASGHLEARLGYPATLMVMASVSAASLSLMPLLAGANSPGHDAPVERRGTRLG